MDSDKITDSDSSFIRKHSLKGPGLVLALLVIALASAGFLYRKGKQGLAIKVSVSQQKLYLRNELGDVLKTYTISTSKFGLGSEHGSNKTPLGRFAIADKIGDGAALGEIIESRIRTGKTGAESDPKDHVETRILWLDGLDAENASTHERYIYIHGTNSESKLGTKASWGCVRMSNRDVIELFDKVKVGTKVEIGI